MWQISEVSTRSNILSKNIRAGISNANSYLDPVAHKISSDDSTFWDGQLLWWKTPDPKGPDAGLPRPPQTVATVNESRVITNLYLHDKFSGLDQHSVWKDPKCVNDDMDQFPAPAPVRPVP